MGDEVTRELSVTPDAVTAAVESYGLRVAEIDIRVDDVALPAHPPAAG